MTVYCNNEATQVMHPRAFLGWIETTEVLSDAEP